jgi:transketolase
MLLEQVSGLHPHHFPAGSPSCVKATATGVPHIFGIDLSAGSVTPTRRPEIDTHHDLSDSVVCLDRTNDLSRDVGHTRRAMVLSGDLTESCNISSIRDEFPDQFLSMGMAEQNMISVAGGLAREGLVPFVHSFGVFLYRRGLDQIAMSVAYPNLPVRLVAFCAGYNSKDGVSHQAIDDLAVLRGLPNMTLLDLGDATEVEGFFAAAEQVPGPIYARMLRYDVPRLFDDAEPFAIGKSRRLGDGDDILIISSGEATRQTIDAVTMLLEAGLSIRHLHVSTIKPFTDPDVLGSLAEPFPLVVTVENHARTGGLGSAVAECLAEHGNGSLRRIGLPDAFLRGGPPAALMRSVGLDVDSIVHTIRAHVDASCGIRKGGTR